MKIALVHKRLDLHGGTERDLVRTAEGLRDLGHEVHLFCSEYGVPAPTNVAAHRVPVVPLGRTLHLWSFAWFGARAVAKLRCDVVVGFGRLPRQHVLRSGGGTHRGFLQRMEGAHGRSEHDNWDGPKKARCSNGHSPTINWRRLWQNLSPYHQSLLAIEKRQYAGPNSIKIIAVSERVKADIVAQYAVSPEKITVLYNGVDLDRFHPANRTGNRQAVRTRWNIPRDCPLVLFVGSGFRRKGLDQLLSLWESPHIGRVFLLVVGADPRLERYRARADAIAPGRIVFAGRQDDIEKYYAAADVLALPSLQEGFGNVVLEGLAAGLPALVSRDVGAAEILRGALSRGVVDWDADREEIAARLASLLEGSRDSCSVPTARTLAEEYSWEKHFRRLEALLLQSSRSSNGGTS